MSRRLLTNDDLALLGPTGVLAVAVLILGLAVTPAFADDPATDREITDAVHDEMMMDPAVTVANLDVTTTDGVVSIDGTVDNLLAKRRATRLARTVKGVRSVVNHVEVHPMRPRSDAALAGSVEDALFGDPATDSYEIDVAASDGFVTLTGTVESWQEKQLAEKVVAGVSGVVGVENEIEVQPVNDRPDHEIATEVERSLRWDVMVDDNQVEVGVRDGRVALSGVVGSASEKTEAITDAWVAGVRDVDASALTVARWARDEDLRGDKYVPKADTEIRDAVVDAMVYDPRVNSFEIAPEVEGGTVTLRGTVDNLKARRAAGQVARDTVGVTRVVNRIEVQPVDPLAESEIASDIEDALERDPYLEDHEIDAGVTANVATLTGSVDSYYEKSRAQDVASRVAGVISVENELAVDAAADPLVYDPYVDRYDPLHTEWYRYEPSYTGKSDAEIREDARDELWWSPFVDSEEIDVTVDDGVVTLEGTVDSWTERGVATENAFEAGATWVDNDLIVDPAT